MSTWHDENGTPPRGIYINRLVDRQVNELLGLAKGVICDGVVADGEVVGLQQWFAANPEACTRYPGRVLGPRIRAMFADGIIDEGERAELKEFLLAMVGEPSDLTGSMNESTRVCFDAPPPTIVFDSHVFTFTGGLAAGPRKWAEQQVSDRGGVCANTLSLNTNYLIIGLIPSPAWVQSTHGRKIEQAMKMKQDGRSIAIVAEETWLSALDLEPR